MDAPQPLRKVRTPKLKLDDILSYRQLLGENQSSFWQRFGVTQSGGSRYESGRSMPRPVRLLISLYAADRITDEDLRVAAGGKPTKS